jgi:uncharacterized protein (TIGR00369 family)
MSALSEFFANHDQSLPKALGIEIIESGKSRVVAQLSLDGRHLNEMGAVQGGIIMAAADIAGALGATFNLPNGYMTTTLESKSHFFAKGSGNLLWAESEPIHLGRTTSVWRALIWRGSSMGDRRKISEVTQTQFNLAIGGGAEKEVEEPLVAERDEIPAVEAEEVDQIIQIADVRRREILRGASQVIMKKGFAKASVREIADAATMPIPTMYKYISSKEEILELIYANFIDEFHSQLKDALKKSPVSSDKLIYALQATMKSFDTHHREVKLLFTESKSLTREALFRVYAQDRRYIDIWKDLVAETGADKRLGIDAELLANFIYYLTTVWAMRHWTIGKWGVEEVTRALTAFVAAATVAPPKHQLG